MNSALKWLLSLELMFKSARKRKALGNLSSAAQDILIHFIKQSLTIEALAVIFVFVL